MASEGKNKTDDAHETALFTWEKVSTTKWGTNAENLFSFCMVLLPMLRVGAVCTTTATKPTTSQTTSSQDCPAKPYCGTQLIISNCHKYVSKSPWIQHHTFPHYQAPAPVASWPLHAGRTPWHPAVPSASTSSARQSSARALLARHQAWASGADTVHRHSKALCRVDCRAVKQRNPRQPCEGLTEVIHARSGGSWHLQNNTRWHAFCRGWEAGYGGKLLLLSAHSASPSLLKLLIKPTSGSQVQWCFHCGSSSFPAMERGEKERRNPNHKIPGSPGHRRCSCPLAVWRSSPAVWHAFLMAFMFHFLFFPRR